MKPPTYISSFLFIKPLKLVVLGKHGPVLEATILLIGGLLSMEAMELGGLVFPRVKQAEEDKARPILGQGGYLDPAKKVITIGRGTDADLVKVINGEGGQFCITQVGDGLVVLLLMLW